MILKLRDRRSKLLNRTSSELYDRNSNLTNCYSLSSIVSSSLPESNLPFDTLSNNDKENISSECKSNKKRVQNLSDCTFGNQCSITRIFKCHKQILSRRSKRSKSSSNVELNNSSSSSVFLPSYTSKIPACKLQKHQSLLSLKKEKLVNGNVLGVSKCSLNYCQSQECCFFQDNDADENFPSHTTVMSSSYYKKHRSKVHNEFSSGYLCIKNKQSAYDFILHLSLAKIISILRVCLWKLQDSYATFKVKTRIKIRSVNKSLHKTYLNWCSIDNMIRLRIFMLTLSFIFHYFILWMKVWDDHIFTNPPEPPPLSVIRPHSQKNEIQVLKNFIHLIHPHIDGHPHIHVPLSEYMRNGIAIMVFKWVLLLWLSSTVSYVKRVKIFGLIASFTVILNFTGTYFGGLNFKTVLYPDIWLYANRRIQLNLLNKSHLDLYSNSVNSNYFSLIYSLRQIKFSENKGFLYKLIPFALITTFIIDIVGCVTNFVSVYRFARLRFFMIYAFLLTVILCTGNHFLSGILTPVANDHHWIDFKQHMNKDFFVSSKREPPVVISKYVPMPDQVEIAVDVYLPPNIVYNVLDLISEPAHRSMYEKKLRLPKRNILRRTEPGYKTQTVLVITRYNRRMTVKWPFTMISLWNQPMGSSTTNVWSWQLVDALVSNGYVVVVADTRGTGASFGYRPVDLSPTEFGDFKAIRDWISLQFWYDGQVAAGGFSYDGMSGLHLAAMSDIKAVLALFTPGGMVCSAFVEDYTGLTMAFERSGTPRKHMLHDFSYDWQLTAGFLFTFGIAAPVKSRESFLPLAINQHLNNWNMSKMVEHIHYTDDFVVFPHPSEQDTIKIAVTQFGVPETIPKKIKDSDTSVYIVGGYCDASSVRGAARLFEALQSDSNTNSSRHELIIGPWTHTGRQNCSPYSGGSHSHFEVEMYWDIIRFLDCSMRQKCWDTSSQRKDNNVPVHFWSVGEERWIAANEFPPKSVRELDLFFDGTHTSFEEPETYYEKNLWRFERNWSAFKMVSAKNYDLVITSVKTFIKSSEKKKRSFLNLFTHLYTTIYDQWTHHNIELELQKQMNTTHSSYKLTNPKMHDIFEHDSRVSESKSISYNVDYKASTRGLSRWVIAKHPFRMQSHSYRELMPKETTSKSRKEVFLILSQFFNYPNWSYLFGTSTGSMLMFSSPSLTKPLRVVGSPILRFSLDLTEELIKRAGDIRRDFFMNQRKVRVNRVLPIPALDVTIFGYLEDVDLANNKVHYVTEGRMLLSHRPTIALQGGTKLSGLNNWSKCNFPPLDPNRVRPYDATLRQKPRVGSADIVYQTGDRLAHHFAVGGIECVVFSFEPIAWYFRPGHIIRLSLVGSDRANFRWSRTQSKEDADLLDSSLLSAIKAGGGKDKIRGQGQGVHVEQPSTWNIPLTNEDHPCFLKLPILN